MYCTVRVFFGLFVPEDNPHTVTNGVPQVICSDGFHIKTLPELIVHKCKNEVGCRDDTMLKF